MELDIEKLKERAKKIRRDTLQLAKENGGYHLGGGFSAVEILVSLYDVVLNDEDKFILSKGHACFPLYALLIEKGYNPALSGHPSIDVKNGINCTTGSLGHGLPIGIGIAISKKLKKENGKIYVLMGDGECQEGTTWESSLLGAQYKLDNLTVIVDFNKIQGSGRVEDILSLRGLEGMFGSNCWSVSRIDGHSYEQIIPSLKKNILEKPRIIIADTIKGKGVNYMEGKSEWHAKFPNADELKQAYEELK